MGRRRFTNEDDKQIQELHNKGYRLFQIAAAMDRKRSSIKSRAKLLSIPGLYGPRLTEEQVQQLIHMRIARRMSYEAMADELGVEVSTVRSRVRRLRDSGRIDRAEHSRVHCENLANAKRIYRVR